LTVAAALEAMSARLTPRLWDSEFFGFPVGEINGRELDEGPLADALVEAQHAGFALVYWQSDAGREVSTRLLERFRGQLVDRRRRYRLSVTGEGVSLASEGGSSSHEVAEHAIGPASDELAQLAIAAGEFSRFRVDPRFPPVLFEALYRTWIERSTLHEIADAVLVARSDAGVSGISTLSTHASCGTIGLISVREDRRGQGVGRALMAASHRWLADRGIREASVATQESNQRACGLYERCGYRVAERSLIYHFWPLK
jgi:dTDP-4-amino-4,6-dideoxy-D-galactose acyltransferase